MNGSKTEATPVWLGEGRVNDILGCLIGYSLQNGWFKDWGYICLTGRGTVWRVNDILGCSIGYSLQNIWFKDWVYTCLTCIGTGERHSRLFDRLLLTKWMVQRLRLHLLDCGGTSERYSRLFDRILLTKWMVQRLRLHLLDWERNGWTTF